MISWWRIHLSAGCFAIPSYWSTMMTPQSLGLKKTIILILYWLVYWWTDFVQNNNFKYTFGYAILEMYKTMFVYFQFIETDNIGKYHILRYLCLLKKLFLQIWWVYFFVKNISNLRLLTGIVPKFWSYYVIFQLFCLISRELTILGILDIYHCA